ncbi:Ff.00g007090.m01.CDS01 [Fusarium sp. VM40]|nr:Ff.00g007090.m01.CDS01 [Fusarium sp. VM40]
MASPYQAPTVAKWSLKPHNHNATRVRNNQRRHRARIKTRLESLEIELAQSQDELRTARDRIEELEALLRAKASCSAPGQQFEDPAQSSYCTPDQVIVEQPLPELQLGDLGGGLSNSGVCRRPLTSVNQLATLQDCGQRSILSPVINILAGDMAIVNEYATGHIDTGIFGFSLLAQYEHNRDLPLVVPHESTTLCRVAFEIIARQNMVGIDPGELERQLWSGFRREAKQGEGCRVDTKVLYAVIDYMSSL